MADEQSHNADEINVIQVLHDTRTAYLRDVRVAGKTLISAGAAGFWFFDWVHTNSGYPERHIGVEYYAPKPDDLPANVEWVANTAGDMHSIDDDVGDVLFSGQNIEHLWEDDVVGFLLEANRILRTGGLLLVDSPNRLITEALCLVHPEHMVELLPSEIEAMMVAAGFEVTARRGIYLCRDPRNGAMLDYQPHAVLGGSWSLSERMALSDAHPDDCYLWWYEGRKTGAPNPDRLRALVRRSWEVGWPERMNRLMSAIGTRGEDGTGVYFQSAAGPRGAVIYGPYAPLKPGRYRITAQVALVDTVASDLTVATLDVMLGPSNIVAETPIKGGDLAVGEYRSITVDFEAILDITFGFQWRVMAEGCCGLKVDKMTRIEKLD